MTQCRRALGLPDWQRGEKIFAVSTAAAEVGSLEGSVCGEQGSRCLSRV